MPDTEKKQRKKADSPGTKEKILAAALEDFGEHGLSGARVDRIAQNAGVNKAMIYYHFNSKENLYREVIRKHLIRNITAMRGHLEMGDFELVLTTVSETYFQMFNQRESMSRLLLREMAHSGGPVTDEIIKGISESRLPEQVLSVMADGVESGALRDVNLRQAWVSFISMNLGYFLLSPFINRILNITEPEQFLAERKTAVVDLFLNGVIAR